MEMERELSLDVYSEIYSEVNSQASREGMSPKRGKIVPEENLKVMRDRKLPPKGVDFRGVKVPEALLQK